MTRRRPKARFTGARRAERNEQGKPEPEQKAEPQKAEPRSEDKKTAKRAAK